MSAQPYYPLSEGTVVGGEYVVLRPLAAGGMGSVYVVKQLSTDRVRALKVMPREVVADPKSMSGFVREAKVGALIDSSHVVEVVGAGIDPALGLPWIAMELLDGHDLASFVRENGSVPRPLVVPLLQQLFHAMMAAHRAGIVHRDLKPENIFLHQPREVGGSFKLKVLDFGISKIMSSGPSARVTRNIGTPGWMSPEQCTEGSCSTASDVWALGLVVFFVLTSHSFWLRENDPSSNLVSLIAEMCLMPMSSATQRVRELGLEAALPSGFDAWFSRCLERTPDRRFRDANETWTALQPVLETLSRLAESPAGPPRTQRGSNLAPGGVNFASGGGNLTPGGVNFASGGGNLTPGGVNFAPGGVNLTPGGVNFAPGGVNLTPGGVNFAPGGVNLAPGGSNLTPGGVNFAPGGGALEAGTPGRTQPGTLIGTGPGVSASAPQGPGNPWAHASQPVTTNSGMLVGEASPTGTPAGSRSGSSRTALVASAAGVGLALAAVFAGVLWWNRTSEVSGEAARPAVRASVGPADLVPIPAGQALLDGRHFPVSAFQMNRHEVTVGEYRECAAAGSCTGDVTTVNVAHAEPWSVLCNAGASRIAQRGDHPLNCVSWQQAADYCAWKGQRLPTEAEWHYAAYDAGSSQPRQFPWGDEPPSSNRANLCGVECVKALRDLHLDADDPYPGGFSDAYPDTASVRLPEGDRTPLGVAGLGGNVFEWTATPGKAPNTMRCRGGNWNANSRKMVDVDSRFDIPQGERRANLGFRCVR